MGNVLVQETALQNIADQIRSDLGTDATYKPADMYSAVHFVYEKGVADGVESAKPAMPTLKATFADNTWENIIWACQNKAVPATWKVGDKKTLLFDFQEVTVGICGKNVDTYADGGTAPLTFCNCTSDLFGSQYMYAIGGCYFGGNMDSMLDQYFSWIDNINVKNAIRAVSKTTKVYTSDYSGNYIQAKTAEKLWLFSPEEAQARFTMPGFLETETSYWLRDQLSFTYHSAMFTDRGDFYQLREYECNSTANVLFGFCF